MYKDLRKGGTRHAIIKRKHFYNQIYLFPSRRETAELIDGVIYDMAPPNRLHQELVMNLSAEIRDYIKKNNGSCKVYPAPFGVFLNQDDKTYVEPDISVICDKSKLDDRGCNGALILHSRRLSDLSPTLMEFPLIYSPPFGFQKEF